jgi:methyl-accepting chemotaxis protein
MDKGHKRRNYFIHKNFQGKFILQLLAVSSAGSILAVLLFIFMANRKIDSLLYRMNIPASVFRGNILLKEAICANTIAVVVIALVFVAAGMAIFRKIAGPLPHIRKEILRIADRNLASKLVLRKCDEFCDFAEEVNHLSTELNRRFSMINDRQLRIAEITEELKRADDPSDNRNRERIAALLEQINGLQQDIGAFRK